MPKIYKFFIGCLVAFLVLTNGAMAQIGLLTNPSYSNNFNFLTGSTITNNSTVLEFYASSSGYGSLSGTTTSTGGGLYAFNSTTSTSDKAMGSVGSNSAGGFSWGFRFANNTGYTISEVTVKYTGEQYSGVGGVAQVIQFGYNICTYVSPATSCTQTAMAGTGTSSGSYTTPNANSFGIDFTDKATSGGTLDGNNSAYRTTQKKTQTLSIQNGAEIMVRWTDINHAGSDNGHGVDDFFFTYQPVVQATSFSTSAITQTSATVSWTAAAVAPSGYIVFRNSGATVPSFAPLDTIIYTAGTTYGTNPDKCVYIGSATTFNETGLSSGTKYNYVVYAYNGSSDYINYLSSTPLSGNFTTVSPKPVSDVTNFLATRISTSQINLTWTNNANADTVIVVASPSLGTTGPPKDSTKRYYVGDSIPNLGKVIYRGKASSYNHTSLKANTLYKYIIYAFNAIPVYSFGSYDDEKTYNNQSTNTDYFRTASTIDTGSWYPGNTGIWESSEDNSYWISSTLVPDDNATLITIQAGDSIGIRGNCTATKFVTTSTSKFYLPLNKTFTLKNVVGASWLASGRITFKAPFTVPANCAITIGGSDTFRIQNNFTNNGTLTLTSTAKVIVDSLYTLNNTNVISSAVGLLKFNGGSTYQHSQNGGVIPKATWADRSLLYVTGMTSAIATGYDQSFFNVTFNCTGNTGFVNNLQTLTDVRGKLYFQSTNTTGFTIALFGPGVTGSKTVNIGGDLELAAGQYLTINNSGSSVSDVTINVGGNLIVGNSSLFRFNFNPFGNPTVVTNIKLKGNILMGSSLSGFDASGGAGASCFGRITFTGKKSHKLLNNSIPATAVRPVDYILESQDTLDMGTFAFNGGGQFTSNDKSVIKFVAGANGIATSLPLTGTKTFNIGTSYIVNATGSGSVTNLGLGGTGYAPASISKLILIGNGNSNTVNLSGDIVVDDSLNLYNYFKLALNGKQLRLNNGFTTTNNGSLVSSSTSSLYIGGTASKFDAPANFTQVKTLTINRPNGATLNSDLTVYTNLNMLNGVMNTFNGSTNSLVTLDTPATISETSSSYLLGKIQISKYLAKNTVNPFGNVGVKITTKGSNKAGQTTVLRTSGNNCGATSVCISKISGKLKGINTIWKISPTNNGALKADLELSYNDINLNGLTEPNLSVFRKTDNGNGNFYKITEETKNSTTNVVFSQAIDSFSEWTLGATSDPLPVDYLSFDGKLVRENQVALHWQTAVEINNDYFEIQRSENGKDFVSIGTVNASKFPNQVNEYLFTDYKLPLNTEVLYYRLKQVDFNGTFEMSKIVKINLEATIKDDLKVWYNKDLSTLSIISTKDIKNLEIIELSGKSIYSNSIQGKTIQLENIQLSKGIFILRTTFNDGTTDSKKLIKF